MAERLFLYKNCSYFLLILKITSNDRSIYFTSSVSML